MPSFGTTREDYGFVPEGWYSLQNSVHDILQPADKRAQNHGYANRVTRAAVHPHTAQNEAFPCHATRLSL